MRSQDCAEIRSRLPFYLEGEVEPLESLRTASHLADCPGCGEEADGGRKALAALRELPGAEPEPPRNIAAGVLAALRGIRGTLGPGAALKWSSLLLLLGAVALPGLFPDATLQLGLRVLSGAGELVDLEAILAGIIGLVPAIIPSVDKAMEAARHGLPAAGSASAPLLLLALPMLLLAAALIFALLSGGLVFSAVRSRHRGGAFPEEAAKRPF